MLAIPLSLLIYLGMLLNNMKYLNVLLILISPLVFADEQQAWLERIQLHGFASQALVYTTDNNFYGDSDNGSADFTELGINASVQLLPKVRVAGQVLSRHAGNMDNGSPHIDYALLDINLISSGKGRLGAYLGRIKNPLGLYNETRDVAHTRQGVFTAQAIYFDKVRDLILSSDGIQFYGEYFLPNGNLIVQAGVGHAIPDDNVEQAYLGRQWAGELDSDKLAYIGRIMYEHDGGRWIYALSGASLEIDFNHQPADNLLPPPLGISSGQLNVDYTVLSTQFNGEKWQLTGELAFQDVDYVNIGGLFSAADTKALGYTLEANYKFTPKWQAFLRREAFYLDKDDKYGHDFHAQSTQLNAAFPFVPISPAHSRYSVNWVIGGAWDITQNVMARAEYHTTKGTATLSPTENDLTAAKKDWDMFAISLSYRF